MVGPFKPPTRITVPSPLPPEDSFPAAAASADSFSLVSGTEASASEEAAAVWDSADQAAEVSAGFSGQQPVMSAMPRAAARMKDVNFFIILIPPGIDCFCADSVQHSKLSRKAADLVHRRVQDDADDRKAFFTVRHAHAADNV